MAIKSYEDLLVWQKSMDLVIEIYEATEKFPKGELYGLVSQMRRCAVSIPSNIAEGSRRSTRKDFRSFINNAFGSGAELETQLKISKRLSFVNNEAYSRLLAILDEIMRMLNRLIQKLQTTNHQLQTS